MFYLIDDVVAQQFKHQTWEVNHHTRVTRLDCGLYTLEPLLEPSQRDIIISCGIHGNETAPIELCQQFIQDIFDERVILKNRLLLIVGNPSALILKQRQVDYNLNRLFFCLDTKATLSVAEQYGYEGQRAQLIKHSVAQFFNVTPLSSHTTSNEIAIKRYHLDLHCSIRASHYPFFAVHPYCAERDVNKDWLYFAEQAGMQALIFSHEPTHTFSYYTQVQHQCKSLTLELGQVAPLGQNQIVQLSPMRQQLVNLCCKIEDIPHATHATHATWQGFPQSTMHFFKVFKTIIKHSARFEFMFNDQVKNFTVFQAGDCIFKDENHTELVKAQSLYLVFPNANVEVDQRAGLLLHKL